MPTTEDEWIRIARGFHLKWNFPNCLGSLDGKHIVLQAPEHSGSFYFNYKKTHSVVLLALVDANYKFIFVDVGCNGRVSDGGVFSRCALSSALENNTLSFPAPAPLPGTDTILPHVVADDAFPLRKNIMKPFSTRNQPAPNRIFNYRLSRARRVVENTFGLLSQVFRIFRRPILLNPKKVETIVLATCVLHNFLLSKSSTVYAPPGFFDTEVEDGSLVPGTWRNESSSTSSFFDLRQQGSNSHSLDAADIRNEFKTYFVSSEGEVAWQYRHI